MVENQFKAVCGIFQHTDKWGTVEDWIEQQDIEGKFFANIKTMEVTRQKQDMDFSSSKREEKLDYGVTQSIKLKKPIFIAKNIGIIPALAKDQELLAANRGNSQSLANNNILGKYFKMNMMDAILDGNDIILEVTDKNLLIINCELRQIHWIIELRAIVAYYEKSTKVVSRFAIAFYMNDSRDYFVALFCLQDRQGHLKSILNRLNRFEFSTFKAISSIIRGGTATFRNIADNNSAHAKHHARNPDNIGSFENSSKFNRNTSNESSTATQFVKSSLNSTENLAKNVKRISTPSLGHKPRSPQSLATPRNDNNSGNDNFYDTNNNNNNRNNPNYTQSSVNLRRKEMNLATNSFEGMLAFETQNSEACIRLKMCHDYLHIFEAISLRFVLTYSATLKSNQDLTKVEKIAKRQLKCQKSLDFSHSSCLLMQLKYDKIFIFSELVPKNAKFVFDIHQMYAVGILGKTSENSYKAMYIGYRQPVSQSLELYLLQSEDDLTILVKSMVKWIKDFRERQKTRSMADC